MEAFGFGVQGFVLKAHQGALRCVTTFYIVVGDRFMGPSSVWQGFATFHASFILFTFLMSGLSGALSRALSPKP